MQKQNIKLSCKTCYKWCSALHCHCQIPVPRGEKTAVVTHLDPFSLAVPHLGHFVNPFSLLTALHLEHFQFEHLLFLGINSTYLMIINPYKTEPN